ncbi:hypothetical protein SK128_021487 [Halocaridina rubra]|uniref:Uncharacterized protein n=1 Tax=Halocaridina rubra TaxID=373956 RepID=A0AAN8WWX5_HALRR
MSQSEDIQNNNFQLSPSLPVDSNIISPATTTAANGEGVTYNFPASASVLAQYVARNVDSLGEESSLSSVGSITYNDEYLEDPLPELTLENLHIPKDYIDPSLGYVFVNNVSNHQGYLDNSQALLQQLEELGVRVNDDDYSSLDFEINRTSPSVASVISNVSDYVPITTAVIEGEQESCDDDDDERMTAYYGGEQVVESFSRSLTPSGTGSSKGIASAASKENDRYCDDVDDFSIDIEDLDHEVAEAEILPNGGIKVTYDNYRKDYRPRISSHQNFLRYLELVHDRAEQTEETVKGAGAKIPISSTHPKYSLEQYKLLLLALRKKLKISERVTNLSALPNKYSKKIQKLLAEEITYDAMTPDSGVHENFTNLSAEEQEKQREEWNAELIKTEEEIQTLRQVLGSKVKHAQDLKRRLGITVWREFTEDFNQSMKNVRESQTIANPFRGDPYCVVLRILNQEETDPNSTPQQGVKKGIQH